MLWDKAFCYGGSNWSSQSKCDLEKNHTLPRATFSKGWVTLSTKNITYPEGIMIYPLVGDPPFEQLGQLLMFFFTDNYSLWFKLKVKKMFYEILLKLIISVVILNVNKPVSVFCVRDSSSGFWIPNSGSVFWVLNIGSGLWIPGSRFCVSGLPNINTFPCKIRTGILAGSHRDLGRNPVGIPARFWPPGNEIPSGQNLPRILPRISPRFSPGCKNPSGQNLAGIPPRISPRFSPRSKNPGGQNLGAILPRISPRFSPGSNNPGGQNLAGMLPRISTRFSPRKSTVAKISARSCREFRQDWRREVKFLVRFTAGISAKF